ncbi:M48 family metallopeptidase [Vibrio cholerae]|uniref:M48 family metallopeptidase n=1 Tax=Vibrio cholerae TaxID=666 RepID=UPI0011D3D15F|nr:M48 family metallopeptidase [Vibrio cholerae]TXZ05307.1 M48 family metallopeptidase [Vibrio cholerae]GHY22820.1 Zn-dependent protease [Vibrio cholerae]
MRITGTAFPPRSSLRCEAELDLSQTHFLALHVDGEIISCAQSDAKISAPVGKLPIRFQLPSGWVFVCERNAPLNSWLEQHNKPGWVDRLEGKWSAWLIAVVLGIGLCVWAYVAFLPWLSKEVAERVPESAAVVLGEKILQTLDRDLKPSELSLAQQDEIKQRVFSHLNQLEPLPYPIKVEFRHSDIGANAFALPGGTLVLLDELVLLAKTPEQLDSIILHELGHVHHRHMLKRLVHSSVLSIGVALLTGESSGVVDNLVGIGVFTLSNGQSRDAEQEADQFAKQAMQAIYGSSEPLAEMFELFQQQETIEVPAWLSTHPDLKQRIDAARQP